MSQANGILIKKASKQFVFVEAEYVIIRKAICVSHCPCRSPEKRSGYSDIQDQLSGKGSPKIYFITLITSLKKQNMIFANSGIWSRIFQ